MFGLDPDRLAAELAAHRGKLAAGVNALAATADLRTGATPKDAVYREDKLVLYRYRPQVAQPVAVPVLIVYALVNRPYVIDLQDDRSTVRGLLDRGMDVYLIDWGYPDITDRYLELDDYIHHYLHRCVTHICNAHQLTAVNLLGICQGGTFSVCYAALHPERVRNLVTMVTPIDFHTPGDRLAQWAQALDVDLAVNTLGTIPGAWLSAALMALSPFRQWGQKYVHAVDRFDDASALRHFLRMERWIFDSPDQAGAAYRQFITWMYQENRLVRGRLRLGGKPVRLAALTMPIFNLYATADHLVPPPASIALGRHVGSADYREFAFPAGHVGMYVSAGAQAIIPPMIAAWITARSASGQ